MTKDWACFDPLEIGHLILIRHWRLVIRHSGQKQKRRPRRRHWKVRMNQIGRGITPGLIAFDGDGVGRAAELQFAAAGAAGAFQGVNDLFAVAFVDDDAVHAE